MATSWTANAGDEAGRALRVAAIEGDLVRLTELLDHGADVDASDKHGRTPLILAAKRGRDEAIRALLDRGASVNARNVHGDTAISCATHRGDVGTVQLLYERGASPDDGFCCVGIHNADLLEFFLNCGCDPNRYLAGFIQEIEYASTPEDEKSIRLLVAHGADRRALFAMHGHRTPLMSAIIRRKANIVRLLVELGADVNEPSRNVADVPLRLARRMLAEVRSTNRDADIAESEAIIRLLVEAGAA